MQTSIITCCLFLLAQYTVGQQRINLWEQNNMPNTKGVILQDSIANERIYQVAEPRIQAFFTSSQENKHAAVLIIPGGGYARLAYEISGYQLAKWFNTMGMHAFVLEHHMPQSPDVITPHLAPLQDAQRAIRIIKQNAASWDIDIDKIGVMGSSAGAHLAATLSTWNQDVSAVGDALDNHDFKPAFQILISPVIDMGEFAHKGSRENLLGKQPTNELLKQFSLQHQVDAETPPAFIVHAFDDPAVPVKNSLLYADSLVTKGVSTSLHIFPQGKHAIALRNNPGSASQWVMLCEEWLIENEKL
ncbi:alpha/beta hydrolase [Sphingobacterium sp. FBM7-1]|uniref:alpha/beta hydrolase n=1 Tax=Sphingobacterium sp. FBM7-1 TaxID=2886688 RepID=UPI001D12164D|nr:alpha/beta hydrolase [Sphingobacterium sp. FBM7-1]MCC2600723.1 alpha/beta hydrolase [Sphingobacterium sp. FBM7-1]